MADSLLLFKPSHDLSIQPEARFIARDKPQMSATRRSDQGGIGIGLEGGMLEDLEGNKSVVPRLHDKRRDAKPVKELVRGWGRILRRSAVKCEGRRGDLVVDFEDGADTAKIGRRVAARGHEALAHAAQEAALVDAVVDLAQTPGAGSQIDRG